MKPVHKGILLENLDWTESEPLLTPETVVVIPLGGAAKEHGPHLRLNNDKVIADYYSQRVLERCEVVVAPTVTFSYYPAFIEYPGSISLRKSTACALIVDICTSLARFGPRRFYVLNTGVSTVRALALAAKQLAARGLILTYTDITRKSVAEELSEQEGGTHADEIETSMLLYMAPSRVDMSKAVKDYDSEGRGRLSRTRRKNTVYSPSGVYGDATLATREKGRIVVEAHVETLVNDIAALRSTPLPALKRRSKLSS